MAAIKRLKNHSAIKDEWCSALPSLPAPQNMCRVMVEGPTKKETETHCRQIADIIKKNTGLKKRNYIYLSI